jgi:hypothetical protein
MIAIDFFCRGGSALAHRRFVTNRGRPSNRLGRVFLSAHGKQAGTRFPVASGNPASILGLADVDFRLTLQFVIRDENDSHPPARKDAEHPAEFIPGEFPIVHVDHRQRSVVTATVFDDASERNQEGTSPGGRWVRTIVVSSIQAQGKRS